MSVSVFAGLCVCPLLVGKAYLDVRLETTREITRSTPITNIGFEKHTNSGAAENQFYKYFII